MFRTIVVVKSKLVSHQGAYIIMKKVSETCVYSCKSKSNFGESKTFATRIVFTC